MRSARDDETISPEVMPPEFDPEFAVDNVVQPLQGSPLGLKVLIDFQRIDDPPFGIVVQEAGFSCLV